MAGKCWVYHKTEDPIIIYNKEYKQYEKKGWKDSPAHFIKLTDLGIDPDDTILVQTFGESVEGVVKSLNGSLNIDKMTKSKLSEYASEHHGCELDLKNKLSVLKDQVHALIAGDSPKEA